MWCQYFDYAWNNCNLPLTLGQLHVLVSFRVISAYDVTRNLRLAFIFYMPPVYSINCLLRLVFVSFLNIQRKTWRKFVCISNSFFHLRGEGVSNNAEEATHFIFGRSMVSFLFFEPVLVCLYVARARARRLVTSLCRDWLKGLFPPTFGGSF